jgi:hypothetical protein
VSPAPRPGSANSCFGTHTVSGGEFYVLSHVNNLPVTAHSCAEGSGGFIVTKTFPAGGFGSDIIGGGYALVDPLITRRAGSRTPRAVGCRRIRWRAGRPR